MGKAGATDAEGVLGVLGVIVLAVAGVLLGAAALDKLASPSHPCPKCRRPVKQDAPACGSCGTSLTWRKSA